MFFDITADGSPLGRIVIQLFDKIVPKTCKNFRELCKGNKDSGTKGPLSTASSLASWPRVGTLNVEMALAKASMVESSPMRTSNSSTMAKES